jgi:hypothetical protein
MDRIENENLGRTRTHRHQGDLVSLLTKSKGDTQPGSRVISQAYFFLQNNESRPKFEMGSGAMFHKDWFRHSNLIGRIHKQTHRHTKEY